MDGVVDAHEVVRRSPSVPELCLASPPSDEPSPSREKAAKLYHISVRLWARGCFFDRINRIRGAAVFNTKA